MLRHLLLAAWATAVLPLAPTAAFADPSADYLDEVLSKALKGATAEQDAWVAEEKATREARRIQGDANRVAHAETEKSGQQAARANADAANKRREAEYKAREEEKRRQQMAEEYERQLRRDEAARRRAIESAEAQAEANRTIMEAINRNAQGIADAYRTGQNAVNAANREKARIEADRAARAAEARYQQEQAAAQRARSEREAQDRIEAARRRAEEARQAAERARAASSGSSSQVASNTTVTSSAPRQAPSSSTSGYSAPRMAASGSSSSQPAKTYRRVESLTYCTYTSDQRPADTDVAWICDGPTQKLQLKNSLRDGLSYTGCGSANTTSRRQTMGKGDIFYCEKAIAPYDRDIASIYNVPATIRGHRHLYECKQTSDTCTRETAVKFVAGGGL